MDTNDDYCRPGAAISLSSIGHYESLTHASDTVSRPGTAVSLSEINEYDTLSNYETIIHSSDTTSRPSTRADSRTGSQVELIHSVPTPNVKRIAIGVVVAMLLLIVVIVVAVVASKSNRKQGNGSQDGTSNAPQMTTTVSSTTTQSGVWLVWSDWTECGVTCGYGIHVRYRACSAVGHHVNCSGSYKEIQTCSGETVCPVYGDWDTWTSWSSCDVPCDSGIHTRTRECVKVQSTDEDCVGSGEQTSQCSYGRCDDCSRVCVSGILSPGCDMCICNQNITGTMTTTTGTVPTVDIYTTTRTFLAASEPAGTFTLNNVCIGEQIIIIPLIMSAFMEQTVEITATSITVTLQNIELPYLTTQPRTKARLVGERLILCCSAEAKPNITYYEWFKDSKVLESKLYPNGTELSLDQLQFSDNGYYSCKANNKYTAVESELVEITVKDSPDAFCASSYISKRTHLPFDCIQSDTNTATFEVGDCRKDVCRQTEVHDTSTCEDQNVNCCTVTDFDMVSVQCDGYSLSLMKVKGCSCGTCASRFVKLFGKLLNYKTGNFVMFATVYLNGEFKTFSNTQGSFSIIVPGDIGRAAVSVDKDRISTTKVIDLSEDTRGTIFFTMYLIESEQHIIIDSNQDNVVNIGDVATNTNGVIANIHIPAMSLVDNSSRAFTGQVSVDIAFLNSTSIDDIDVMPGILASVNNKGQSVTFKTFGIFHVWFRSFVSNDSLFLASTLNVTTGPLVEPYRTEISLYKLQPQSGIWWPLPTINDGLGEITSTDITQWLTVGMDIKPDQNVCFFNIRVYEGDMMVSEVTTSRYQTFIQSVHINNPYSFETYGHTFSPSTTCFKTICDGETGYLEVWISNFEASTDEYLKPADPSRNSDIGLSMLSQQAIEYSVNNDHLTLKFVTHINGPFFESETECLVNSETTNHFKFYFHNATENTYTLAEFLELTSADSATLYEISQRVWYQKRVEGYRMCYVKAKFVIQTTDHLTVRAISAGGMNANISGEVLGIRDVHLSSSTTVCLEYKCSGTIGEGYFTNTYDYTKVTVKHVFPTSSVTCNVDNYNQDLIDEFPNQNQDHVNSNAFTFLAPISYGPRYGLYSASTSSGDFESARTIAKGECESAIPMNYHDVNPDDGLAVTFTCS